MKKSQLKQIIREVISENTGEPISPTVKATMLHQLQSAAAMVKKCRTFEELDSLDGAEHDYDRGTFMVMIYNDRIDR